MEELQDLVAAYRILEISYFVINDKFVHANKETKPAVESEIKANVFDVNKDIDQLFKDAIKK